MDGIRTVDYQLFLRFLSRIEEVTGFVPNEINVNQSQILYESIFLVKVLFYNQFPVI
jgi:hypothetical protein